MDIDSDDDVNPYARLPAWTAAPCTSSRMDELVVMGDFKPLTSREYVEDPSCDSNSYPVIDVDTLRYRNDVCTPGSTGRVVSNAYPSYSAPCGLPVVYGGQHTRIIGRTADKYILRVGKEQAVSAEACDIFIMETRLWQECTVSDTRTKFYMRRDVTGCSYIWKHSQSRVWMHTRSIDNAKLLFHVPACEWAGKIRDSTDKILAPNYPSTNASTVAPGSPYQTN